MRISHFFIDRPIFAAVISIVLVILVLAVNVVGDWLRDRFNPKLDTGR